MWPFMYPYTNFHELNLDWIIEEVKKSSEKVNDIPNIVNTAVEAAEMGYPFVNVKSYGAKGDGIADDTLAFQEALNSGCNVYVPMESQEKYRITKTLNMKADGQVLFSMPHGWNYSKSGIIETEATPAVDARGFNCTAFYYLNFYGGGSGTCILLEGRQDNTDAVLFGNTISNYYTSIEYNGRGLELHNNFIGACEYGIKLNYSYNGVGGNSYQQPESGFRAFNISGNKFHDIDTACIETLAPYINNVIISDNIKDVGQGCLVRFMAGCKNAIISNNQVERDCIAIEMMGANEKITINNNIFDIVSTTVTESNNPSILCGANATIKDSNIIGNIFSAKYVCSAIDILNGGSENINISNNTFKFKKIMEDMGVMRLNHNVDSPATGFVITGNTVKCDEFDPGASFIRNYGGKWSNKNGFIVSNLFPDIKALMSKGDNPGTVQPDNI